MQIYEQELNDLLESPDTMKIQLVAGKANSEYYHYAVIAIPDSKWSLEDNEQSSAGCSVGSIVVGSSTGGIDGHRVDSRWHHHSQHIILFYSNRILNPMLYFPIQLNHFDNLNNTEITQWCILRLDYDSIDEDHDEF